MPQERRRYSLTSAPASEPVTTSEIKTHLRITTSGENTLLDTFVTAAREYVEQITGRALITQTWDLYLDSFKEEISIPKPPLQSVSSIKYIDNDGAEQTLATSVYTVDTDNEPGLVYKSYNQDWPSTRDIPKAVNITYVAGYGNATAVPEPIVQAIKLLAGHMYENREASSPLTIKDVPMAVDALLNPYRRVPV